MKPGMYLLIRYNFTTRGCLAVVGLVKKFLLVMVGELSCIQLVSCPNLGTKLVASWVATHYGDGIIIAYCNFTARGCLAFVGLVKKFLLVMVM